MGSPQTMLLRIAGTALVIIGVAVFFYALAALDSVPRVAVGLRGLKRSEAMKKGGWFAAIEPLVRFVAARVQHIRYFDKHRPKYDQQISHAGEILGLSADEYIALSIVTGLLCLLFGTIVHFVMPEVVSPPIVFMGTAFGFMIPYLQISGMVADRFKQVNRGLPYAIDLAALAMGAGLDFPGSLRQVTEKAASKNDALIEELLRVINELDLGRTRKQALEGFAERAPTDSVKDFVQSVIQSEEKGNPLSEVLTIQANTLRMKRSVAAEEGAARAGILMMGPLMLIFFTIILILMGPFVVSMAQNGGMGM